MRIHETGKIAEDFYALGIPAVPVFLLDGPVPVLFDAGFSVLVPLYEREIKEILGSRSPAYLFLTHSHWDHIGGAGHFKTLWPELRIACHSRIREILTHPGAVQAIKRLNRQGTRDMPYWGRTIEEDLPFKRFTPDLDLKAGQRLELAPDCHVTALHTPGHTWDLMSYWMPERKILIASEAAGCELGGRVITEFLVDYDAYRQSLLQLIALEPEILCLAHEMVFTGQDARDYMMRSLEAAEAYVDEVEGILQDTGGDVERTVGRIKASEWEDLPYPKQPEPAYLMNTRARVGHILERMNKRDGIGDRGRTTEDGEHPDQGSPSIS